MIPRRLLSRFSAARKLVEVAVGNDFETALAFRQAGVRELLATDVYPRDAPPGIRFALDDVTEPNLALYRGADLVYGVRLPEELQSCAARAASRVGASLAIRALKDEWADVSFLFPKFEVVGEGWRLYPAPARERMER